MIEGVKLPLQIEIGDQSVILLERVAYGELPFRITRFDDDSPTGTCDLQSGNDVREQLCPFVTDSALIIFQTNQSRLSVIELATMKLVDHLVVPRHPDELSAYRIAKFHDQSGHLLLETEMKLLAIDPRSNRIREVAEHGYPGETVVEVTVDSVLVGDGEDTRAIPIVLDGI